MTLTCDELRDLLFDHHAGELVVEKQESFNVHIGGCPDCTNFVDSYSYTVTVTRKLPRGAALPAGVEARLREVLKEHLGGPTKDA